MDKIYYTKNGTHPEDEIYRVKTFINDLQNVQESYFNKLVADLNLDEKGEDFLFDYIFNCKNEISDFSYYLENFNKKYDDVVKNIDKK